eukprot:g1595.t1
MPAKPDKPGFKEATETEITVTVAQSEGVTYKLMFKNVMVEAWDAEGVQTVAVGAGKGEVTAEGLEPTSTYEFKVVASDGSGEAESDVATYDTQARCFAP